MPIIKVLIYNTLRKPSPRELSAFTTSLVLFADRDASSLRPNGQQSERLDAVHGRRSDAIWSFDRKAKVKIGCQLRRKLS